MAEYNLVVVGGGAAGIMAALTAKRTNPALKVLLLERSFALGRKILVSGAGRCNITNINLGEPDYLDHYYCSDKTFVQSVFSQFGYQDIIDFIHDLGIETYVERKTNIGKVFPTTNQAKTLVLLLEDELKRLDVEIRINSELENFSSKENGEYFLKLKGDQNSISTVKLIIATGGKTYPALGADGNMYIFLGKMGYEINTPVVAAVPVEARNQLSQEIQGVKQEIEVSSFINGKFVKSTSDEVMFTQYGFSGPAILNISREISVALNRNDQDAVIEIKLNFFPGLKSDEVQSLLKKRWLQRPNQTVLLSLVGLFPQKLAAAMCKLAGIKDNITVSDIITDNFKDQLPKLLANLTNYRATVTATRGWNEGEFTAGGIVVDQVNPDKLETKKDKGLFFCGELLDVDADVGGYNLSWAWSSGWVAGKSAASN